MELVRYRPGEAIRWLQTGAENIRRGAQAKGKAAATASAPDARAFGENLKNAAGALIDYSKGAYADLMHRQAEASEYVLHDDYFDIVRGGNIKTISYDRVTSIEFTKDRAVINLEKGTSITIKPFAHLVAGRARVPVGWSRNGIEVPFELLIEELAARCKVEFEEK
jgi:hypothetical protein